MVLTRNENKCRLCLMKLDPDGSSLVSIFDDHHLDRPIPDIIFDCLQLKVTVDEPLPRVMCEQCFAKLGAFSNFKLQCHSNDRLLRESLSAERGATFKEDSNEGGGDDYSSPKREKEYSATKRDDAVRSKKKFVCRLCNKSYTRKFYLGRHVCVSRKSKTEAPDDEISPKFVCDICNKSYVRKRRLVEHLAEHADPNKNKNKLQAVSRNVPCERCGRVFRSWGAAHAHLRTVHERQFVLECPICGRKLMSKGNLKVHMNTHNRNDTYECNVCEKRLHTRGGLQFHLRTHTGEKPFACRFCDNAFRCAETLKRHERRHTGETPYKCPLCEARTSQLTPLKEHFARHHKGVRFYDVYKKYDRKEALNYTLVA